MRALAGEAVARLPMQSDLAPEPEPPGQALTPLALHALDAFERPRPAFTLQTLGSRRHEISTTTQQIATMRHATIRNPMA